MNLLLVDDLIAGALDVCKGLLGTRPIQVNLQNPGLRVRADFTRAEEVLVHLIQNAHLYSLPDHPITISAEEKDDFVQFSVADQGPGIGDAELGLIFDKFYRGADQRYRVQGTGMGLPIAKAIVEAHGGTISVVSQTGTRIRVLVWFANPEGNHRTIMSTPTILVVDDEPQIRRVMRTTLSSNGYTVIEARSGEEALESIRNERPELVLLDVNMPGMSGLETCREIRNQSDVAIIMLTVRNSEHDKVLALDAGADDYVVKPFGMEELLARIRAALRRTSLAEPVAPYISDDLEIDFERRKLLVNGQPVRLTPKEFDLLRHLVANQGKPLEHRRLLQAVWGPDYGDETEYLRVFINQLRKKIEPDPAHPKYIHTDPWVGYRFEPDAPAAGKPKKK